MINNQVCLWKAARRFVLADTQRGCVIGTCEGPASGYITEEISVSPTFEPSFVAVYSNADGTWLQIDRRRWNLVDVYLELEHLNGILGRDRVLHIAQRDGEQVAVPYRLLVPDFVFMDPAYDDELEDLIRSVVELSSDLAWRSSTTWTITE